MARIREVKDEPLSPKLVLELHRLVSEDTLDGDATGRFRRANEPVVVGDEYGTVYHDPPPADDLPSRMSQMCAFANAERSEFVHPAVRAAILHFWLAYDHPFVDGNGRTARALFYWSMLHAEYWLCELVSISQIILKAPRRYARALLHTETDSADLTYFVLYHLEVLDRAIGELEDYIKRKSEELRMGAQQLRGMQELNHRQKALVMHALRNPGWRYSINAHRRSHGVAYQTARTDLMGLEERGLVRSEKVGKRLLYAPVQDLADRLRDGVARQPRG